MRGLAITLMLIVLLLPRPAFAAESEFGALDGIAAELEADLSAYEQYFSVGGMWRQIRAGEIAFDLRGLWQLLLRLALAEVAGCGRLLAELALLAMIAVLLENLASSFGSGAVSGVAQGVIYLLLTGIAAVGFQNTAALAAGAVQKGSDLLFALLPMLMTFIAALGGTAAAGLMHPALLFAVSTVTGLLSQLIFPLIYFAAVLKLLTCLSPRFNVDKLARLCRSFALGLLTVSTGLFVSFLSIGGFAAASVGGLAVKAAKAAGSLFIPVVGKSLADALDSVIGVSLVLKNGIGLFGVVVILLYTAYPALKILAISLMYKLTGALLEPMGGERVAAVLYDMGGMLQGLFAAVAVGGLFFFFVLALCVGMGNISMMMR